MESTRHSSSMPGLPRRRGAGRGQRLRRALGLRSARLRPRSGSAPLPPRSAQALRSGDRPPPSDLSAAGNPRVRRCAGAGRGRGRGGASARAPPPAPPGGQGKCRPHSRPGRPSHVTQRSWHVGGHPPKPGVHFQFYPVGHCSAGRPSSFGSSGHSFTPLRSAPRPCATPLTHTSRRRWTTRRSDKDSHGGNALVRRPESGREQGCQQRGGRAGSYRESPS